MGILYTTTLTTVLWNWKIQPDSGCIVTGAKTLAKTDKLYNVLWWFKLSERRDLHKLLLFFKMNHGLSPLYLSPPFWRKARRHSIRHSVLLSILLPPPPLQVVGTLCMQLLQQFYNDSFETLQVFREWSEDVHIVWIWSSDYFVTFSTKWTRSFFWPKWIDSRYIVYAAPPTVLCKFLWYCTGVYLFCLIWFFTSHQQSFSYIGTGLPGLNQY